MTKLQDLTQKLQQERAKSPAHDAVYHMWALRKRTRGVVTRQGLSQRMKKEGFNFDSAVYDDVLAGLAGLGMGTLHRDARGHIKALSGLSITLDSIGKAACGDAATRLKTRRMRRRYRALSSKVLNTLPVAKAVAPAPEPIKAPIKLEERRKPDPKPLPTVSVQTFINGKNVLITVPRDMEASELALILNKMQDRRA